MTMSEHIVSNVSDAVWDSDIGYATKTERIFFDKGKIGSNGDFSKIETLMKCKVSYAGNIIANRNTGKARISKKS